MVLKKLIIGASAVAAASILTFAQAANIRGVSDDRIVIGTIQDLSGPLAALSRKSLDGMQMRVDELNESGDIHGRKITLVVDDHGYQPRRALLSTQRMIQRDGIFAMLGVMGSATAMATIPPLVKSGVLSFVPISAVKQVYMPLNDLQWAAVATYDAQMRVGIKYMLEQQDYEQVCVIYQDDDLGTEVVRGIEEGLRDVGRTLTEKTSFQRGSTDFSSGVAKLRSANCDLVVIGSPLREPVGIMKEARKMGWEPTFFGSAASYTIELPRLGGKDVDGYYVMSGLEIPYADASPSKEMREWARAYQTKYKSEPDVYSAYGYTIVDLFIRAAEAAGKNLTTESMVASIKKLHVDEDMFGAHYEFSEEQHNGNASVRVFQLVDGKWKGVSEMMPLEQ